jgi:short subunit dehydrogenase-like uncharacterized protein
MAAPKFDSDLDVWTAPFVMAAVNTRVARRSAGLFAEWNEGYGEGFTYHESMYAGSRWKASAISASLGVFAAATVSAPGRALVKVIAPKPGEGPSDEACDAGWMHCQYVGTSASGKKVYADMKADGDPGYKITVMTLCEAGLTLALDEDKLPGENRGGVLTTATGLGQPYLDRMRAAGLTLEIRA